MIQLMFHLRKDASFSLQQLVHQRCQELIKKIEAILKKLHFFDFTEVNIFINYRPEMGPACRFFQGKVIFHIPYLFLLKPQDIPSVFQGGHKGIAFEKWRLLFHWSQNIFYAKKSSFNTQALLAIGLFSRLIHDKKGFEQALEFILGHELTHAFKRHRPVLYFRSALMILIFSSVVVAISHQKLKGFKSQIIQLIGISASIGAIKYIYTELKRSRIQEAEADMQSAKLSTNSLRGAFYYFNCALNVNDILIKKKPLAFLESILFSTPTHGTLYQRLTNLSKIS